MLFTAFVFTTPASAKIPARLFLSSQCPIITVSQPAAFIAAAGRPVVNAPKFFPGATSSLKTP